MIREKRTISRRFKNAALVVIMLPFVLPLALLAITLHTLYRIVLYLLVWALWVPRGRDILFVSSDSPIWHEYMATQVLPIVQDRAVVLNWSARKTWGKWELAVAVFRHFGGGHEFNPMVLLFRPLRRARAFRFFPAFQDWKRGYTEPVDRLRQDLLSAL
jgi:hypothetical protein